MKAATHGGVQTPPVVETDSSYAVAMADLLDGTPFVIIGAGGFGREVLDVFEALDPRSTSQRFIGFVDTGPVGTDLLEARGSALITDLSDASLDGASYVIGIGDPHGRRHMSELAQERGLSATSIRHPTVTLGAMNLIGAGFVACAHVSITTNVRIGCHVHLNLNATVGHDCVLGDFVTINPGANLSGNVRIEDGATIGTGAAVIQGVAIGAGTVVGAGAVVTRDLPEGVIAVGSPARPVRSIA